MVPTSIEEAYRKFDELSAKHIDRLRKFTKQVCSIYAWYHGMLHMRMVFTTCE